MSSGFNFKVLTTLQVGGVVWSTPNFKIVCARYLFVQKKIVLALKHVVTNTEGLLAAEPHTCKAFLTTDGTFVDHQHGRLI